MKKYDLLLLAIYGVLLTLLILGAHLHIKERRQVHEYMIDWQKKKINVVIIEDTKLNFKVERGCSRQNVSDFALQGTSLKFEMSYSNHDVGDFKLLGTSLLLENVSDFQIHNDTLFIGKKAMGNLYELVVDSHVQVDLLDAANIPITEKSDLK